MMVNPDKKEQYQPPPGPPAYQGAQGAQEAYSRPAPPVPPPEIYWQPQFQADVPTSVDWDHKLGNGPDGWGNQELQHYTADLDNSFQ